VLTVERNVREVAVRWRERLLFEGGASNRPAITVDGDGEAATSPVELLLVAAAACSAADVVLILQKMRVQVRSLDVTVRGTRREQEPRRYTAIHFRFVVVGDGADEAKARRAVALSLEKYCSVVASLAPDITITCDVALG
jgi:putative redox protein